MQLWHHHKCKGHRKDSMLVRVRVCVCVVVCVCVRELHALNVDLCIDRRIWSQFRGTCKSCLPHFSSQDFTGLPSTPLHSTSAYFSWARLSFICNFHLQLLQSARHTSPKHRNIIPGNWETEKMKLWEQAQFVIEVPSISCFYPKFDTYEGWLNWLNKCICRLQHFIILIIMLQYKLMWKALEVFKNINMTTL